MKTGVVGVLLGAGMLYAHIANAMVSYDRGVLLADSSAAAQTTSQVAKKPAAKSTQKHHHAHKKHHHSHPNHYSKCHKARCASGDQPVFIPQQGMGMVPTLEQVENNMEVIDRDHAARASGGRGR